MKKYLGAIVALLLLTLATNAHPGQTAAPAARTLKVQLHYTGTGTVDEKHKIYVFLFTSTDFMQGDSQPISTSTASSKEETITLSDLTASPLYAAVVYDPSGDYDGQSQPPAGSSTALYAKTPNVPDPIEIEPGKTVAITLTFDDTHKMR